MISQSYKNLVNGFRTRNGLPELYPASGAAKPKPDDIVDASEGDDGGDNDGLELLDRDEALDLMRKTIKDINGEMDQPGGDDEADAMTQLGALAKPARRLMIGHLQAKLAEPPVDEEKRAKAVSTAAAFILACHRQARGSAA